MRVFLGTFALASTLLPPPPSGQISLVDVTQASGLSYMQNQTPGASMLSMCGGAAAGDYDGDGWVDLFVTRIDRRSRLFRNLGTNAQGQHQGFINTTLSAFSGPDPGPRLNGASFGDVDGDGDLDLLATGFFTPQHFLWINDGAGHFVEEGATRGMVLAGPSDQKGFSSSFGDYDLDGYLDVYICEWGHQIDPNSPTPSNSRLLRNLGDSSPGYFEDVTDSAGVALESVVANGTSGSFTGVYAFTPRFADFNDDGWPDLAIAGDFTTSRLFWNKGDGSFVDGTVAAGVGRDENGMGAAVADFNGDGNLDWFVTSIYDPADTCSIHGCNWGNSGNRLYIGNGAREFADATDSGVRDGGWGWGATEIDFDNDGALDLAMTNGINFSGPPYDDVFNHDPTKLWRNESGLFVEVGLDLGVVDRGSGKGIVKLDYDRDGDQDLFIVNNSGQPVLYRNDGGNQAHWIQIQLRGSNANSAGIGARVRLWPNIGDAPLVREQSASSNYLSQNETLLHFGLGDDSNAARIEVTWPRGTKSVLTNVASGQRLVISQP
jgi:hypothetical protein